jgi:hypothetical protein
MAYRYTGNHLRIGNADVFSYDRADIASGNRNMRKRDFFWPMRSGCRRHSDAESEHIGKRRDRNGFSGFPRKLHRKQLRDRNHGGWRGELRSTGLLADRRRGADMEPEHYRQCAHGDHGDDSYSGNQLGRDRR